MTDIKPSDEHQKKVTPRPRIATGIEGLDVLLQGGLQQNKCYLVAGEAGAGKTILGLQYLVNGALSGQNGIYVTVDEKPHHLIEDAAAMGWDLENLISQKKLTILDTTPYFTNIRLGKEKQVDLRTVMADLAKYVRDIHASRLVIDPIAPLVFNESQTLGVQEYIRSLVFAIDDNLKCTTIITAGIASGSAALSHYGVEEFVVSGILVLGIGRRGGRRVRTLYIPKMRGTATDLDDHAFEILGNRGIVVREAI